MKADIEAWHANGIETAKPSLGVLRKRWNMAKDEVCLNAETAQVWWPECSKECLRRWHRGRGGRVLELAGFPCWQACREAGGVSAVQLKALS